MENVPNKYLEVNKDTLKPMDITDPDEPNAEYEDENGIIYEFDKKLANIGGAMHHLKLRLVVIPIVYL